ncbi:MAG TPA: 1,4-alpha-glucan branching enzyme, partial [Chloroflexi bacterium]|nr:1,4-alpha-glucan branching enzyme [Chloroflexota bacterium]
GEFNDWNPDATPLTSEGVSGIWEAFVPHVGHGAIYKYQIWSRLHGQVVQKADPFAIHAETSPKTGSVVWDLEYERCLLYTS